MKQDITLIDAFRISKVNILILSYLLREVHDIYLSKNTNFDYIGNETTQELENFMWGQVIGIILAGVLSDSAFKKRPFTFLALINLAILFFDIIAFLIGA